MDVREMLDKAGAVEGDLWMVGTVKGQEVVDKGPKGLLAIIRYFGYKEGVFYVCRSAGPGILAIENQFDRNAIDLFKISTGFFFSDPTIKIMVDGTLFSYKVSQNTKNLKLIAKLMNDVVRQAK